MIRLFEYAQAKQKKRKNSNRPQPFRAFFQLLLFCSFMMFQFFLNQQWGLLVENWIISWELSNNTDRSMLTTWENSIELELSIEWCVISPHIAFDVVAYHTISNVCKIICLKYESRIWWHKWASLISIYAFWPVWWLMRWEAKATMLKGLRTTIKILK